MGCKKCKSKDINLNHNRNNKTSLDNSKNQVIFSNSIGKFFYFLLLTVIALCPITNLVILYLFYKATYGGTQILPSIFLNNKNEVNQNTNETK